MPTTKRRTVPRSKLPTDPTLAKVQGALKQNVDFFLSNIGSIVKKYTELLEKAKAPEQVGAVMIKSEPMEADKEKDNKEKDTTTPTTTTTTTVAEKKEKKGAAAAAGAEEEDQDAVYVTFPDNAQLVNNLQTIKREAYELSTTFDGIHDWIMLNMPELKEEDSTGLEIMSVVMEQVSSLTETIRSIYKLESKYFSGRAELEKSILRMPECKTLQLELMVNDEDTWVELGKSWRNMIRSCLIVYTMLSNNMARLEEPTGKSKRNNYYYQ